jgi:hypothetical protein
MRRAAFFCELDEVSALSATPWIVAAHATTHNPAKPRFDPLQRTKRRVALLRFV